MPIQDLKECENCGKSYYHSHEKCPKCGMYYGENPEEYQKYLESKQILTNKINKHGKFLSKKNKKW